MRTAHYQSDAGIFSTLLAFASFALGTILLALRMLLPQNDGIVVAGFFYVLLAVFTNGLAFLYLLYCYAVREGFRGYYAQKIFLLLCSIPVAAFYVYVAFELIH